MVTGSYVTTGVEVKQLGWPMLIDRDWDAAEPGVVTQTCNPYSAEAGGGGRRIATVRAQPDHIVSSS